MELAKPDLETASNPLKYGLLNLCVWRNMKYTYAVVVTIAMTQGLLMALIDLPVHYLFKDELGLEPASFSFYLSIYMLPWSIKPVYGFLSDAYPILDMRRKPWLFLNAFLAFACLISLTIIPYSVFACVSLLLGMVSGVVFVNVIGEALVVEITQRKNIEESGGKKKEGDKNAEASKNISLFFVSKSLGTLISAKLSGYLLEHTSKRLIFGIGASFPFVVMVASLFLFDRPVHAPGMSKKSIMQYPEEHAALEQLLKVKDQTRMQKLKTILDFALQPYILKPITVICIIAAVPSSSSIMFYFFTNELGFEAGFMGDLKVASNLAHIVGILIFNRFFKSVPFKKVYGWTVVFFASLNAFQIILVERWNEKLGISDVLFSFGDTMFGELAHELMLLPKLILIARLCPKSLEGTLFSFFMALNNFSTLIGRQLGSLMMVGLGISNKHFGNLTLFIVLITFMKLFPLILLTRIDTDKALAETEKKSH